MDKNSHQMPSINTFDEFVARQTATKVWTIETWITSSMNTLNYLSRSNMKINRLKIQKIFNKGKLLPILTSSKGLGFIGYDGMLVLNKHVYLIGVIGDIKTINTAGINIGTQQQNQIKHFTK